MRKSCSLCANENIKSFFSSTLRGCILCNIAALKKVTAIFVHSLDHCEGQPAIYF